MSIYDICENNYHYCSTLCSMLYTGEFTEVIISRTYILIIINYTHIILFIYMYV